MNSQTLLATALLTATSLAGSRATAADAAQPPAPAAQFVFVDLDAKEAADVRAVGENAISRLLYQMGNEVSYAIAKNGVEAAIDVAHLKNLPMTGDRIASLPRIKAFKLTSLNLRNAGNLPDAADQLALKRMVDALSSDAGPPKLLIERIDSPSAAPEWRVYRPLGVGAVCLKCHGDPADFSDELKTKLATLYPGDKATGYQNGEWRGLLRVTVDSGPPPSPKKPAR